MVLSMTGYGKAVAQLTGKKITVEVRSLNSKQTDINVRVPQFYREKELEVRDMVAKTLQRGKIDLSIYAEVTGVEDVPKINLPVVTSYINQLKTIKNDTGIDGDVLAVAMRMPDVLKSEREDLSDDEWAEVSAVITQAMQGLQEFRQQEGDSLKLDMNERIVSIQELLLQVPQFENERIETVKARFDKNLESVKFDKDRFEQELIFYIEKLDINEEKVRLSNHLTYFLEVMNAEEYSGKKLGFICQEIGREINTLGSKANHSELQKIVVQMKEELERIKEQVLNAL